MKTLSMIAIVTIVIISAASVGVFIEKVNDYEQQPYLTMAVSGIKENYTMNEPVAFVVTLEGYGTGCGDTKVAITKENDTKFQQLRWASEPSCVSNPAMHNFKFNSISANTKISQTGNYILTVTFDDLFEHQKTVVKRFSIMESVLPDSLAVAPTNRTHAALNYSITGDNKILDTNMTGNANTVSIAMSLEAPSNGTLTLVVPAMLDDMIHNKGAQLFVLLDGHEVHSYNETKSGIHEVAIPFKPGTRQVIVLVNVIL